MPRDVLIRDCREADLPAITAIYAANVRQGTASFETDPPDEAEMARRRATVLSHGMPYLVAEIDSQVAGYAYVVPYRPRRAYRFTVEHSVYVDARFARHGVGTHLMRALIAACQALGFRQMIAVIGDSANSPSIHFHRSLGFEYAGTLRDVGFKFDRWLDTVLMQLSLPRPAP